MSGITLKQLGQKIDDMKESVGIELRDVKKTLDKLNGSVQKNTSFRNMMTGGMKFLAVIIGGGALITFIISIL